jgi:hypothetical protein
MTKHLKLCIGGIPKKTVKKEEVKEEPKKKEPETVKYKGHDMVIGWSGSEKYKHINRPGIYNGITMASSTEERDYKKLLN